MADAARQACPAVVLAGGRAKPDLRAAARTPVRGLAPLRGRPLIAYCLDALSSADSVGLVTVVGDAALRPALSGAALVEQGDSLLENVRRGLDAAGESGLVLLAGADVPFLTAAAVDDFARRCRECGADLCYGIVRREVIEERFPGMRRTYAALRDGTFTGGNLFMVRGSFFYRCEGVLGAAYGARKSPVQLARLLGLGTLAAFFTRRLTVARAEARVGEILGGRVRAIVSPFAEIAADVDRAEDLAYAEAYLQVQAGSPERPPGT